MADKKTFVCFDTNVLVRCITQATKGFEPEQLGTLLKDRHISLLLPEPIEIELEKLLRGLAASFRKHFTALQDDLLAVLNNEKLEMKWAA